MTENKPELSPSLEEVQKYAKEAESLILSLKQQILEIEGIRSKSNELAISLNEKLVEANTAATAAIAARTQVTDDQAVVAENLLHVQNAKEHIDKLRTELNLVQTTVTQSTTEIEANKDRVQAVTDAAVEYLADVRAKKTLVEDESEIILSLHESAKSATSTTKTLANRAEDIEKKLIDYEAGLDKLRKQSEEQLETIIGLLPGATAAGLAHAFDDRRKTFLKPAKQWQVIFVVSVVLLALLALLGYHEASKDDLILGWDNLARLWIVRLPIAGALIWLALHASREAALAKRLEEDYGYKAAIAASFLGFQQQMAKIGEGASEGTPLSQLCQDTLSNIGNPPGRIYENHRLTVTPAGELAEAAVNATKAIETKKP